MGGMKGVFFDLGGTLRIVEQAPAHQERAKLRMAQLAGAEDADAFLGMVEERYKPYREWALSENREAGDYELWEKWLAPEMGRDRLREACHELTYQYRQVKGLRRVVDGGREVIEALSARGYRLGIISNLIGEEEIPNWLREDGLAPYFSAVVLSSVCHIRKPDPAIYRMGCERLGLEASQCVSIADNLGRDITGAKAAGIGANVLFISPEKLAKKAVTDENRPDYIVHRFLDILALPILQ